MEAIQVQTVFCVLLLCESMWYLSAPDPFTSEYHAAQACCRRRPIANQMRKVLWCLLRACLWLDCDIFDDLKLSHDSWVPGEHRCEPDICNDLQLGDMPDVSGHLPAYLLCTVRTIHYHVWGISQMCTFLVSHPVEARHNNVPGVAGQ